MQRLIALLATGCLLVPAALADTVTCLGRIEPLDGVRVLSGPSHIGGASSVIVELRVEEGDWVEENQLLAVLDDYALHEAEVLRQQAMLEEAEVELKRLQDLSLNKATSAAEVDKARFRFKALQAQKRVAEVRQDMAKIHAPLRGQVLKIYTRPGEQIGPDGILELGETDRMTVVAEVYETDVHRIAEGAEAVITSPALPGPASGKVIKLGYRVGKMDVLSSDPVADTDARVVEAVILVDDPVPFQRLTNLQVDVEIQP